MDIYGKMAYLKGLLDGMDMEDGKQKKLFSTIFEVLDELIEAVDDLDEEQEELQEYVEAIDEDLEEAEDFLDTMDEDLAQVEDILGIDDDDDMEHIDEDDLVCDGKCDSCEDQADCLSTDDLELIEVECPECGETVCFYNEMLEDEDADTVEILCPKCDAVVYTFEKDLDDDIDEEDSSFDDDDD